MNKKHTQNEFLRSVSELNMRRAFRSSVVVAVLVPLFILAASLFEWDNPAIKITFIVTGVILEIIQIAYMFVLHHQYNNDEFDLYHKLYISYYAVTITLIMIGTVCDMQSFGSFFFYFSACLYLIFVPVLSEKERLVFVIGQTVIVISMVIGFKLNMRSMIDVCLTQLATVFMSAYQHNLAFNKQKMNQKLKIKNDMSEHDALTGLYNRRGLESRISAIWPFCERNKIRVGIIAVDIDFFKKYNDTFGHPKGDECLREVASVLKESAQRSTDVVTRTGGEEFLIFVQDTDDNSIVALAMKIRKILEERAIPQAYFEVSKNVTVSIGAASFIPTYGKTFDVLYEEADKALYAAKKSGRNCIVYEGNIYGKIRNGIAKFGKYS